MLKRAMTNVASMGGGRCADGFGVITAAWSHARPAVYVCSAQATLFDPRSLRRPVRESRFEEVSAFGTDGKAL